VLIRTHQALLAGEGTDDEEAVYCEGQIVGFLREADAGARAGEWDEM